MYIVFEGIDGAGKSTQIKLLKEWLEDNGFEVETIVEPTDSKVGKLIRELLTYENATSDTMQKTLGLLFAADRLLLMDKIGNVGNKIILSDRSFISSLAYQKPIDWIAIINKYAKKPDLVLLLDLDIETSVSRCLKQDSFENEEFLTEVKDNYLKIVKNYNYKIINGNNGQNKVSSDIKRAVASLLGLCSSSIK